MEMFEGGASADGIVDEHGADLVVLELPTDRRGGNVVLLQVGEDVDVHKQPVGQDDQAFDTAVEQHFQIAFEAAALVVDIGKDGKVRGLKERVLNAAQHQRAIRVGHVEHHDAHGVAAAAAQRARKQIGTVSELLGGAMNFSFGSVGNVAGQRGVVQHDGNGGGRLEERRVGKEGRSRWS